MPRNEAHGSGLQLVLWLVSCLIVLFHFSPCIKDVAAAMIEQKIWIQDDIAANKKNHHNSRLALQPTNARRRRMSSVPSQLQSLPSISCHHTSRHRGYTAKNHSEDKHSHREPKGVPLERIAAISPHESPVGRIRLRLGMEFSKSISPIEEVH